MTIYNINFGIGWASSGVEYAQVYRAKLLRQLPYPTKFIFLDFIQSENIQTLTSNIGFKDDEVIWLYQYFTDVKIAPTTYTVDDLISELGNEVTRKEQNGKVLRLYLNNQQTFVTCYLKNANEHYVDRAEFVVNGMLIRKDFYSYVRTFSEYYAPFNNKAKIYMRQFYNEDGSIAYREYIDEDEHVFVFDDARLYSKQALVAYFIRQLRLDSDDIIIIDRATDVGQAILENKGSSKVGVVVHAEHFSEGATDGTHILWNNYYEYQFENAQYIDFFITATDLQRHTLSEQFKQYKNDCPRIRTIPVGSIESLQYPEKERKPYSIITASRLATEKHVDWIVEAVIKAKHQLPQLSFDIYGQGEEQEKIKNIIIKHRAEDYIQIKGHRNLRTIYQQYELFIAASQSEGFGLTLMEAVGSGLGMIGFDVNYGSPTFIRHHQNGYLIPIDFEQASTDDITTQIAHMIIRYFKDGPIRAHEVSYNIAESFKTSHIVDLWRQLIEEVLYD
ncbi:MAG: accessory Sec system glycosyltransferase GtfA [Staphylococcus epidermidis]|nr:accessory Sec system glycosyltransferase GtfA [Staphylococcus epidermidis]